MFCSRESDLGLISNILRRSSGDKKDIIVTDIWCNRQERNSQKGICKLLGVNELEYVQNPEVELSERESQMIYK